MIQRPTYIGAEAPHITPAASAVQSTASPVAPMPSDDAVLAVGCGALAIVLTAWIAFMWARTAVECWRVWSRRARGQ